MSTTTPQGFDADKRAQERENAGVTVGGITYKPIRKTTEVMRDVRAIGRKQSRLGRRAASLDGEADKLYDQADAQGLSEGRVEELEAQAETLVAQADALRDEASHETFVMLARLLADDGGNYPAAEALEEHLDLSDAQELGQYLMPSDDEDEPDPTSPTADTTT